jgi:hypothetical protein
MDILRLGGLFVVLVPWYGRERPSARGDGVRPQQIVVYPKCLPSRLPGAVAFHRDKEPTAKQASMRSANGGPPSAYLPCKPIARRISTLALWVHGEPSLALHWALHWPFTGMADTSHCAAITLCFCGAESFLPKALQLSKHYHLAPPTSRGFPRASPCEIASPTAPANRPTLLQAVPARPPILPILPARLVSGSGMQPSALQATLATVAAQKQEHHRSSTSTGVINPPCTKPRICLQLSGHL